MSLYPWDPCFLILHETLEPIKIDFCSQKWSDTQVIVILLNQVLTKVFCYNLPQLHKQYFERTVKKIGDRRLWQSSRGRASNLLLIIVFLDANKFHVKSKITIETY